MKDKIQKIREELARLKEETSIGLSEHENGIEQGRMEIIEALSIFLDSMQEEPVSEDLEEAFRQSFEKVKEETQCVYDYHAGFVEGAKLKEEQMMAKAIDGEVGYWNLRGLSVNVELPRSVNEGDKVKVIVIRRHQND